jgi:hypothetical protein
MFKTTCSLLLFVALSLKLAAAASLFADRVVSYDPGTGATARFLEPNAALGAPSSLNPFGEPTDPFNPPYGTNQIVSLGAGGWLIVQFQTPLLNHPLHPYGLDFTIFGGAGFIITNEFDLTTFNWIGLPATDGSLFAQNTGTSRISVSRDGLSYYTLDPSLAPGVDSFPPSDSAGDALIPVAPELTAADFAGATLDGIRSLYDGSAGGASFDISWARDAQGRAVFLPEINFVRIDVLSGKAEIDAVAAVGRVNRGAANL